MMVSTSYRVGRWLGGFGRLWWVLGAVLLLWILSAQFGTGGLSSEQRLAENARIAKAAAQQQQLDRQKKIAEAQDQLRLKCVESLADRLSSARADIAMGKPEEALARLQPCQVPLDDPQQRALIGKAEAAREVKAAKERREILARQKKLDAEERARKRREGVTLGMSMQDAIDSSWGRPEKVNRSTGSYGVHEQWVYGGSNYLYFENGVLKSIQN